MFPGTAPGEACQGRAVSDQGKDKDKKLRLGVGGPEMIMHAEEIGKVARKLAESCGVDKLVSEADLFVKGQVARMEITCSSCAVRMIQDASAEALRAEPIERPAWDRRSDFLLRLIVAFYPHGVANEVKDHSLVLPRHCLVRLGGFWRDVLGTFPYSDLNSDASRLMTRFPSARDSELRSLMFSHPPSRLLLMKLMTRLLAIFQDAPALRSHFIPVLAHDKWPNIFKPTEKHFSSICSGLFGDFMLQLQKPRQGDDMEQWFGRGATGRLLDLLEMTISIND